MAARTLDALSIACASIWLAGGVPWGGKRLLSHGADPRRAAIGLVILAAAIPACRELSWGVRSARGVWKALQLPKWRWRILAFVTAWACALGALQALGLSYPMYDVGIFHQILWSLDHGLGFWSSISGAGNFLYDHFSPALFLLAPLHGLTGGTPLLLPLLHPLILFGGVAGWIRLAERLPGATPEVRSRLAAATLVFGVSLDSLWGNLRWGFHENSIAFCAFSWALCLLFTATGSAVSRWARILGLLALSALSKEILLVNAAFVLVAWIPLKRPPWKAAFALALGAGLLIGGFAYFQQLPHPENKNYFLRYYSYLGTGLGGFLGTLLGSPGKVISAIGWSEILRYLRVLLLPFLGIPLFFKSGRASWLLLGVVPSFASALLSTYPPLRGSGFHYVLEIWPTLVAITLIFLVQYPRWIGPWAVAGLLLLAQDPWGQVRNYAGRVQNQSEARRALSERIPEGAAVVSDELGGAWVANRRFVTRWPELKLLPAECPDYAFLKLDEIENEPGSPWRNLLLKCTVGWPSQTVWTGEGWVIEKLIH